LEDLTNGEDSRMDSWVDAKFNGDSGGDTDSDTGTDTDIDTDPDAEFSDDSEDTNDYPDDKPFQIMTKEVSVEQYYKCYDEYEVCGEIRGWESCNVHRYRLIMEADGDDESEDLEELGKKAANCVNWYDARQFCKLIGGDLPTKEQWEYAARSGYKNATQFPWGEETVDCEKAIIYDGQGKGCGNNGVPEEGCSLYPEGRTETGVCDMIGNLWEWVKDDYSDDGASWQKDYKTIKGGGFNTTNIIVGMESESYLSITKSTSLEHPVEPHNPNRLGFRCIRYIEDSKNTDEEDDKGKNEDKDQDEK
jgi:formylglycine-generating enzyme required for sulfatase activity